MWSAPHSEPASESVARGTSQFRSLACCAVVTAVQVHLGPPASFHRAACCQLLQRSLRDYRCQHRTFHANLSEAVLLRVVCVYDCPDTYRACCRRRTTTRSSGRSPSTDGSTLRRPPRTPHPPCLHTAKQVSKLCRVQIGCRDTCVQPVRRAKSRRATRGTARFRAPCLERGRPFKAREAVQQHNRAQPAHAL